jgi:hypothetical protein
VIQAAVAEQRLDDRGAPIGSDMDSLTVMLIGAALAIPSGALATLLATAIQRTFVHRRCSGVVVIVVNTVIASRNSCGQRRCVGPTARRRAPGEGRQRGARFLNNHTPPDRAGKTLDSSSLDESFWRLKRRRYAETCSQHAEFRPAPRAYFSQNWEIEAFSRRDLVARGPSKNWPRVCLRPAFGGVSLIPLAGVAAGVTARDHCIDDDDDDVWPTTLGEDVLDSCGEENRERATRDGERGADQHHR